MGTPPHGATEPKDKVPAGASARLMSRSQRTAPRHQVFERLGRPAKLDRGAGLAFGNSDRGKM